MRLKDLLLESTDQPVKIRDLDFDAHSEERFKRRQIQVPDELNAGMGHIYDDEVSLEKWKKSFIKRWGSNVKLERPFPIQRGRWSIKTGVNKKLDAWMSDDADKRAGSYGQGRYSGD